MDSAWNNVGGPAMPLLMFLARLLSRRPKPSAVKKSFGRYRKSTGYLLLILAAFLLQFLMQLAQRVSSIVASFGWVKGIAIVVALGGCGPQKNFVAKQPPS